MQPWASTPGRAESCTPRSCCTDMPRRASFPKCILPEAHLREILNWECTPVRTLGRLRERSEEPSAQGGDAMLPLRMHSYPRRNAQPSAFVLRPGAHSWCAVLGLTERGSLAGPGPKLTTCLGESMVRGCGPQISQKGSNAWAAQVCRWRGLSTLVQRRAGAPIGRAVPGPALIGSRNRARIPIGRAYQPRL